MQSPHRLAWPVRTAAAALRRALAPACVLCSVERGDPVCPGCLADYLGAEVARCRGCAIRVAARGGAPGLCGRCLAAPRRFDAAFALADYAPPVDALVGALKFRGRLDLGHALGVLLARRYAGAGGAPALGAAAAVVPLPLAPRRLRERGYNQSEELARAAASELGLPLLPRALCRVRNDPEQHGLPLARRRANVRGAFRAPAPVGAPHVLLVDDVLTTGATLEAAAACLKSAGVRAVTCLVVARTP